MNDFNELFNLAEERIVLGQLREAGELLDRVKTQSLPRAHLCRMAGLLRRVGNYEQALRLLMPIVRPKAALLAPATSAEIAEYAINLQRAGSLEEARELLEQVDPNEVPEALLYRAIFRFPDWDYAGAVPVLRQLIEAHKPQDYLHQVGRLNLAAALVTMENFAEADAVLAALHTETAAAGRQLLLCNSLEVAAQSALFTSRFTAAEDYLNRAEQALSGVKTFERLWLIKWRAAIEAFKSQDASKLAPARAEAGLKNHWETFRELDFLSCKTAYDPALARKLYFGSAAPAYRARLERHFEIPRSPRVFITQGFNYTADAGSSIHFLNGFDGALSPGDLPHLVLMVLLSDAYRSLRSGQLHSRLFPGDYYNPFTSLDRVHQVMKRARTEIAAQWPGADIVHTGGVYRLDLSNVDKAVEIAAHIPAQDALEVRLRALEMRLESPVFESKDVQNVFSLSRAAANRLIATWKDEAKIAQEGSSARSRRYRIKKTA